MWPEYLKWLLSLCLYGGQLSGRFAANKKIRLGISLKKMEEMILKTGVGIEPVDILNRTSKTHHRNFQPC